MFITQAKELVLSTLGREYWEVLSQRACIEGNKQKTLDAIARVAGVTRQRIEQKNKKVVQLIKKIDHPILDHVRETIATQKLLAIDAFTEVNDCIILGFYLHGWLYFQSSKHVFCTKKYYKTVLTGLTKLKSELSVKPWVKNIEECSLSAELILDIVKVSGLFKIEGQQISLAKLPDAGKLYDALRSANAPVHLGELAKLVGYTSKNKTSMVISRLGPEIVPIGRSGYWTINRPEIHTESIPDSMYRVVLEANRPLSRQEVVDRINRPKSARSVDAYLYRDKRFLKVARDLWTYTTEDRSKKWTDFEAVGEALEKKFPEEAVPFSTAREHISDKFGIPASTAKFAIVRSRAMKKVSDRPRLFQLNHDWRKDYAESLRPKVNEKSLRSQIEEYIKQYLADQKSLIRPLARQIAEALQCVDTTVFTYIRKSELVHIERTKDRQLLVSLK